MSLSFMLMCSGGNFSVSSWECRVRFRSCTGCFVEIGAHWCHKRQHTFCSGKDIYLCRTNQWGSCCFLCIWMCNTSQRKQFLPCGSQGCLWLVVVVAMCDWSLYHRSIYQEMFKPQRRLNLSSNCLSYQPHSSRIFLMKPPLASFVWPLIYIQENSHTHAGLTDKWSCWDVHCIYTAAESDKHQRCLKRENEPMMGSFQMLETLNQTNLLLLSAKQHRCWMKVNV